MLLLSDPQTVHRQNPCGAIRATRERGSARLHHTLASTHGAVLLSTLLSARLLACPVQVVFGARLCRQPATAIRRPSRAQRGVCGPSRGGAALTPGYSPPPLRGGVRA